MNSWRSLASKAPGQGRRRTRRYHVLAGETLSLLPCLTPSKAARQQLVTGQSRKRASLDMLEGTHVGGRVSPNTSARRTVMSALAACGTLPSCLPPSCLLPRKEASPLRPLMELSGLEVGENGDGAPGTRPAAAGRLAGIGDPPNAMLLPSRCATCTSCIRVAVTVVGARRPGGEELRQ
jgi:hypothetical protein